MLASSEKPNPCTGSRTTLGVLAYDFRLVHVSEGRVDVDYWREIPIPPAMRPLGPGISGAVRAGSPAAPCPVICGIERGDGRTDRLFAVRQGKHSMDNSEKNRLAKAGRSLVLFPGGAWRDEAEVSDAGVPLVRKGYAKLHRIDAT